MKLSIKIGSIATLVFGIKSTVLPLFGIMVKSLHNLVLKSAATTHHNDPVFQQFAEHSANIDTIFTQYLPVLLIIGASWLFFGYKFYRGHRFGRKWSIVTTIVAYIPTLFYYIQSSDVTLDFFNQTPFSNFPDVFKYLPLLMSIVQVFVFLTALLICQILSTDGLKPAPETVAIPQVEM